MDDVSVISIVEEDAFTVIPDPVIENTVPVPDSVSVLVPNVTVLVFEPVLEKRPVRVKAKFSVLKVPSAALISKAVSDPPRSNAPVPSSSTVPSVFELAVSVCVPVPVKSSTMLVELTDKVMPVPKVQVFPALIVICALKSSVPV